MTESNNEPLVDSTTPDHESNVDEAISRNGTVAKVISTRTGLLDLPPEIRLMIFRHLLVRQKSLPDHLSSDKPVPDLRVLRTSKRIHQEASDVFYRENRFWYSSSPVTRFPPIVNTIQNIGTNMILGAPFRDSLESRRDAAVFAKLMRFFGNHSIVRRNLVVGIYVDPSSHALKWLVGALGRSTNFRTVTLQLGYRPIWFPRNDFPEWCEHLKTALEPLLGHAEEFRQKPSVIGLRFHPIDYINNRAKADDGLSRRDSVLGLE